MCMAVGFDTCTLTISLLDMIDVWELSLFGRSKLKW